MMSREGSADQSRYRLIQLTEVIFFLGATLFLLAMDPFPTWPTHVSRQIVLSMATVAFLVYVTLRTREWRVSRQSGVQSASQEEEKGRMRERRYQVPRRISLLGICGVTLVSAFLVSSLQLFDAPVMVIGSVIGFVFLVAASQLFLARVPRLASTLAGAMFGMITVVFWDDLSQWIQIMVGSFRGSTFIGVIAGALIGYFSGVFTAAIFMLGDALRLWALGPHKAADDPLRPTSVF